MEITVFASGWQMQCCGGPFRLGSRVSWKLARNPSRDWLCKVVGQEIADGVDAWEDHHPDVEEDAEPITGTVTSIAVIYCQSAEGDLVPGSGVLTELDAADPLGQERPDMQFVGYLVRLAEVDVKELPTVR